ncbi:MAG: hypothetical protein JXB50_03160 [Spirochaetes bacterium]|nr:hypothetical protein [Spirochaetota bacterium]
MEWNRKRNEYPGLTKEFFNLENAKKTYELIVTALLTASCGMLRFYAYLPQYGG